MLFMTMTSGSEFASKSIEERYEIAQKIFIPHPGCNQSLRKIDECILKSKSPREPKSLLIAGEAGSGETEVLITTSRKIIKSLKWKQMKVF